MKTYAFIVMTLLTTYIYSQCNQYQIYESFTNTLTTQGGTWAVNSISASTSPTRTGSYALGFNANGDWIRTPLIANPGVLSFWYRRNTTTTAWTLNVQTSPNGTTWTTRGSVTSSTLTYQQYTLNIGALGLTNVYIRLIDARTSGTPLRYVDDLSITSTVSTENTLIPLLGNCSQTLSSALTYTITDTGGPTDTYNNNLDQTVTLSPSDNTKKLQLNFTAFDLEAGWDFLYIYDGPNTGSTLLATLDGTTLPSAITAENASGQLTLRFTSDGSGIRAGFTATASSIAVCTTPTVSGTLTSNKSETTVNDGIALTNIGHGGSLTKLEWSFDNFATVSGTITNPTNPYNILLDIQQPNIYFRTTAKDGTCPSGISNTTSISLRNAPVYTYGITDGDYITNVTFNDINNTSTNDGDAYSDYTNIIANVTKGDSYTLSVSATNTFSPGQGYAAWIDWNGDGIFQTTENVLLNTTANSATTTVTIPNDAISGDVLLRVLSVWNATPNIDAYYATVYGYGEIEEYVVRVSVALPVELLYFEGYQGNSYNMIEWATASESNSLYFDLQVSQDGETWKTIATTPAAGNSTTKSTYRVTDMTPNASLNYYQLVQYDIDGNYKVYGPIIVDNTYQTRRVLRVLNLLGKEAMPNESGLLIEVYDDGTTKKIIR